MKCRHLMFSAALVLGTAAITTTVVSQDAGKGAPPEMTPEMQAMMQKWEAFKTPGPEHKVLDARVGKWNGVVKMWMDPNQPQPDVSNCTTEAKWIMDGRYLAEDVEGNFNGETFVGQSWLGYDNLTKKYGWTWIDNMGTGFMTGEGTYDAATKTFKYTTNGPDVMAGKYVKGRSVEKWTDKDHWVSEMHSPGPDGKEYKMMEITYTRAK